MLEEGSQSSVLGLLLVCTLPFVPSSTAMVSKVIYMSVIPKSVSLASNSLWNPRFLYPVVRLTSSFGYLIDILIITLKNRSLQCLLPALDFFFSFLFFLLLVFPISVNGITIVLGIFLDFSSPISFSLSQQVPVVSSSKPILHLSTSLPLHYYHPRSTYIDLFFGKLGSMSYVMKSSNSFCAFLRVLK